MLFFRCFLMEAFLLLFSLFLLIFGIYFQRIGVDRRFSNEVMYRLTLFALIVTLLFPIFDLYSGMYNVFFFANNFFCDFLSLFIKIISCLFFILVLVVFRISLNRETWVSFEFYSLYLLIFFGLSGMMLSNSFIVFFVFMELFAYCFYTLGGMVKNSSMVLSIEAVYKYFILNAAISSTFILLGSFVFIFLTGSFYFTDLFFAFSYLQFENFSFFWFGIIFFLGLFMKFGVAPFHFHEPDVYEGLPYPLILIFTILPKLFFFYVLLKFCLLTCYFYSFAIIVVAFITIAVGCFGMLEQRKIKRFMAYSSINNVGFVLLPLALGYTSVSLTYLVVYLLLNIGFIGCFIYFTNIYRSDDAADELIYFDDLAGVYEFESFIVNILLFFLLTFAGVPPLIGFWIKYYIVVNLVFGGHFFFAIVLLLFSVLGSVGYLRSVVSLYFDDFSSVSYWKRASIVWFKNSLDLSFGIYGLAIVLSLTIGLNFIAFFGPYYFASIFDIIVNVNLLN